MDLPQEAIGTKGSNLLLLEGGPCQYLEGNIATCDFSRGHPEPLSPHLDLCIPKKESLLYAWNLVTNCYNGLKPDWFLLLLIKHESFFLLFSAAGHEDMMLTCKYYQSISSLILP